MTMIDRVKSVRLLATAAMVVCPASAASAQKAGGEPPAASSGGLEEIVVTARKREESMQDVPASISALSASELDRRFDSDVRDFADSSPNIVIDDTQQGPGGVAAVYIRGIGVADVEKSVDPAVGVVFDDVYIGQSSGSLLKAIDIDRVEVLRGPQGTLFGRNATGGVINLARSRPTYDLTGKARITYGRFDSWKVEGVASTGLSDNVAVKVSGAYEKSDGYIFNSFQNQNGQRSEFYAVSGALLFEPTDKLDIQLSYDHQKTRQDPPQLLAVNRPTDLFCVAYSQCSPAPGVPTSGDRYTSVSDGRLEKNATFKLDMAIAKASYDLGSDMQVDYIFGWLKTNEAINQDFDAGPQTLYHTDRPARWRQTTNELRLTKGGSGPLSFVLGAYLWDSAYTINLKNYIGFAGPALLTSAQDVRQTNKSWAIYGEADYEIVDRLTLTVGARYTKDKKSSIVNDLPIFFYDTTVEENPVGTAPGAIVMADPVRASWSKFTPRVSLRYEITDQAMIYALWSRGYRGGGFNGRPSTIGAATIPYDPETLDNYEAGFKTEFANGRVRLNGAAFLMKYNDMQQDLDVPAPGTSTGRENRTINAASAELKGFELDLTARPVDGFTLNGNIGYLDAKYKDFMGDIYSTGTPIDASFLKIRRAPKWTWSVGGTYEADIGSNASAWISGDVHYIGPHEITFLNNPNLRNSGQYLVDASINLRFDRTTISLFGKNLADEKGWTIGYDVQGVWSYAAPRPRRTWGVAVTQTF
ncbi:TonB-dependent receptor [Sphingopyxis sp. NFH-91]|uniref:TonB-dependent receptor n=1 Tax=Sphingopyxis sp. NFH-91 TaxID=2744457 RepID=UPI001F17F940|nr:TonB-dependent receptor [Sphingopyxis sp. NFH-91]